MTAVIDYQLTSGHADWPRLRDSAQWAEANGFGAIWVVDHIAGRSMGGDQALESFTWLGAMAASTQRIELGSLVTNVWNRSVGTAIVAAATVAEISQRRFWFGIGAGTSPKSSVAWEQNMVGATIEPSMERRQERVEHLLDLSAQMWSSSTDEFPTCNFGCPPAPGALKYKSNIKYFLAVKVPDEIVVPLVAVTLANSSHFEPPSVSAGS